MVEPTQVKRASEAAILAAGGGVNDFLPVIGLDELSLRPAVEVAHRALVLSILVNLSFSAPPPVARQWLLTHGLLPALTADEVEILNQEHPLDDEEKLRLRWNLESLWASAWVGGLTEDLAPTQPVGKALASLFPSLRTNESPDAFLAKFKLRTLEELYSTLDLYYRAHWYARDCQLRELDSTPFNAGVVQQRRHFLEWATQAGVGWNEVDLST